MNVQIGIWLPYADFLATFNCLKSSEIELASDQSPVRRYVRIGIWLPIAGSLVTLNCLKSAEIELASGCQLPVANSHEKANRHLAAICRFPIRLKLCKFLPVARCQFTRVCELASRCDLPISYLPIIVISSEIELVSGCQFLVASSQECANWLLAAVSRFPNYPKLYEIL